MSDERDPLLESIFARAAIEPPDDDFTAQVMANIDKRSRHVMVGRFTILALLVVLELLLSSPLQNYAGAITEALSTSLIEIKNEWLTAAVAPLNSIAGLVGVLFLGVHSLYRRMVR